MYFLKRNVYLITDVAIGKTKRVAIYIVTLFYCVEYRLLCSSCIFITRPSQVVLIFYDLILK